MRRIFLSVVGLLSLSLIACSKSDGHKQTFPVTGSVLIDKKAGEHATVVFHPVNPTGEVVKPHGKVKNDGTFTLTTYSENDGAPAGDYRVTVELWLAGRADEGPKSNLPVKLSKPESSGLTATVNNGPTELKAFEVSRR